MGVSDPLSLELLACRDAVLFAKEEGYQSIIIETDCFNAKNLWEARQVDRSIGYHILQEMQEEILSFHGFQLHYASRHVNSVAHMCAKEALVLDDIVTFSDVISGFPRGVLHLDGLPLNE